MYNDNSRYLSIKQIQKYLTINLYYVQQQNTLVKNVKTSWQTANNYLAADNL